MSIFNKILPRFPYFHVHEKRFTCDVLFFDQLLGLGQLSYSLPHVGFYDYLLIVVLNLFFCALIACKLEVKSKGLCDLETFYFCYHIFNIQQAPICSLFLLKIASYFISQYIYCCFMKFCFATATLYLF